MSKEHRHGVSRIGWGLPKRTTSKLPPRQVAELYNQRCSKPDNVEIER